MVRACDQIVQSLMKNRKIKYAKMSRTSGTSDNTPRFLYFGVRTSHTHARIATTMASKLTEKVRESERERERERENERKKLNKQIFSVWQMMMIEEPI